MALDITAEGFSKGASIPRRFTCDGDNLSPILRWSGEPPETRSFALILDDPDAPGSTWNHWLVWDILSHVHSLPEGKEHHPAGTSGTNDFGRRGYGGPCPPRGGGSHRYFFRLHALDTPTLGLSGGTKRSALERVLPKHVIAEATYMGRYERK